MNIINSPAEKYSLLYSRWPWHVSFWLGYALFRLLPYYITATYYDRIYLEYMLLSELFFVAGFYLTVWMYKRWFVQQKYLTYFVAGIAAWALYLYGRTYFQFYYLRHDPGFKGSSFSDVITGNIAVVVVYFLFITAGKYFKDGYIAQQYEAERKKQQLLAEVNNLKSQIAPHFLFNTLNNLYGLSVEKSDKLPGLMLRLSDLLRHSLYETQKPHVNIFEEIKMLESYTELERIRLEDDVQLNFENSITPDTQHNIAPLLLIVFVENAFKHGRLVQSQPVEILITTALVLNSFTMTVKNNYNSQKETSSQGIGLNNVKRRLEVLYPGRHELTISRDETYYSVNLQLQL